MLCVFDYTILEVFCQGILGLFHSTYNTGVFIKSKKGHTKWYDPFGELINSADASGARNLQKLSRSICIDLINDSFDTKPDRYISEDLNNASVIGKGCLLEH